MSADQLDLSKAIEASYLRFEEDTDGVYDGACIRAALPHILEALAERAAREACFPKSYDDAVQKVATGLWLRAKAEEARA